MENKMLVSVAYTDDCGNVYSDFYIADNKKVAVELGNNLLLSFEKEEGKQNIEYSGGNFKDKCNKWMGTEECSIDIKIEDLANIPCVHNSRVGAPHKDELGYTVYGIEYNF